MNKIILYLCTFIFATTLFSSDKKFVKYEDFGAKGDGKTNDFTALINAHNHANKHNLPVKANDNATYYLGGDNKVIVIQTDTNWGDAKFIIDDRNVENRKKAVFNVTSKMKSKNINNIKTLKKNQEKIDYKEPYGAMIIVENKNVKRFIRRGALKNKGKNQRDCFIVDKNGNIDQKVAIQWDFNEITSTKAIPIDNNTLTITGGHITTIANTGKLPEKYDSYSRALIVERANTIIDNVKHFVIDNGDAGYPYTGFFTVRNCANVIVKNCLMTGRKRYSIPVGPKKIMVGMGSYDISVYNAHNVTFQNCKQTNDINDTAFWGIMGANFTKNLTYDNCKLSRFDSHQGVRNATIKNSELGYAGVKIIGTGTLLIENTIITSTRFITFRPDYGSSWDGDLIIKNCTFNPKKLDDSIIIYGTNKQDHDFGYTCSMPQNITINGLTVTRNVKKLSIFNNPIEQAKTNQFPYIAPKTLDIKNVKTKNNEFIISSNKDFFKNMKVIK